MTLPKTAPAPLADAGYHAAVPHGLRPPGFHAGPAAECDDASCHAQPPRTDPAGDLEVMVFSIATGGGIVEPKAFKAALAALVEQEHGRGMEAAARWLLAEYPGPGRDVHVRRAAERLLQQDPTPAVEEQPS